MKNLSGQESLWVAFPLLLVTIILITGLIFLPSLQSDIRGKAAPPPVAVITPKPLTTQSPEIICSDLYTPVCGTNSQTYASPCEANQAGITRYQNGPCDTYSSLPVSPDKGFLLPTTN